jgi:hypothetical protein
MRKLSKLDARILKHVGLANRTSGEELIRIARVLHPGEGANRAAITGTANANGSYLCDFGPKAKVTEGDNAPRPFVNPALAVTRKRHRGRARRALSKGVKEAMGG